MDFRIVGWHVLFTVLILLMLHSCMSEASEQNTAKWLARSCIGEANWLSVDGDDSECAALMNIYKKRAIIANRSIYWAVRKYSAAVKNHPGHKQKWVLHINRECIQPNKWPKNLDWGTWYTSQCKKAFNLANSFLRGEVRDPLPLADHYGGSMDAERAHLAGWYRLKTKYRNRFYSIKNPKGKKENNGR